MEINKVLNGKYEILKELGRGGMSIIYLCVDLRLQKLWAIKEIDKTSSEFQTTVNEHMVMNEIKIMKNLDHPDLPRIVDIIDTEDRLYVVMDYIEGESLKQVCETNGPVNQDVVCSWMLQICDIFEYLHSQNPPIIYRDLKPSNIMLKPDGTLKLIDFGIAREYKKDSDDTNCLGTRGFASPEHFEGRTDNRSDIYTIGVTMYQLLTGNNPSKAPYKIYPIREIDKTLSSGLEKIVLKCIKSNPDERYQNVSELRHDLINYKKMEEPYINSLKTKLTKVKRLFIIAAAFILTGTILITSNFIIDNSKYDTLVSSQRVSVDDRIEDLEKAASIKPAKKEPYILLIDEFSKDGFTEPEAGRFLEIYNANREKIMSNEDSYKELNFEIGEAFLVYFSGKTDNSIRNKLIMAEPFFKEAIGETPEGKLSKGYCDIASFYKKYIIGSSELIGENKDKSTYEKALNTCNSIILNVKANKDSHNQTHLKLISYELILQMIDEEKESFAKNKIDKSELLSLISSIEKDVSATARCCELGGSKINNLEVMCKQLTSRINSTYDSIRKQEGGKK